MHSFTLSLHHGHLAKKIHEGKKVVEFLTDLRSFSQVVVAKETSSDKENNWAHSKPAKL